MGIALDFSKYRHKQDAAWPYMGALEAKAKHALRLLKQGRARECRRYLEEASDLIDWFDALPNSRFDLKESTPTMATGGLPTGDKE